MAGWFAAFSAAMLLQTAPGTVTKEDFRTQSPSATNRQLRDQLWGIFENTDQRRSKPARRPLDDIWLTTQPYPTPFPGLCRKDSVVLRFAPVDSMPDKPDARTPVRAYGIDSSRSYAFLRAPVNRYVAGASHPEDVWHDDCTRLASNDDKWFSAPDLQTAVDGYRAGRLAASALAAGKVRIGSCDRAKDSSGATCEAVVAYFAQGRPASIERCDAPAGVQCFRLWGIDSTETRITIADTRYSAPNKGGPPDDTILSIDIAYFIVFGDTIID